MNAAIRAVTRMGIYVGAQVYLVYEVNKLFFKKKNKQTHNFKIKAHIRLTLLSTELWKMYF